MNSGISFGHHLGIFWQSVLLRKETLSVYTFRLFSGMKHLSGFASKLKMLRMWFRKVCICMCWWYSILLPNAEGETSWQLQGCNINVQPPDLLVDETNSTWSFFLSRKQPHRSSIPCFEFSFHELKWEPHHSTNERTTAHFTLVFVLFVLGVSLNSYLLQL